MIHRTCSISGVSSKEAIDILLLPPEINPVFSASQSNFMPLGLLSLAASLRKNGFHPFVYKPRIRLFSMNDYREAANDILGYQPEIIGFSTWCITYPASLLLAEQIRKIDKNIPIIFGGPQASILPVETLSKFNFVDYVLSGEADYSLIKLVKNILEKEEPRGLNNIGGLTFRDESGEVIQNKTSGYISNLDELPVPAYDLIQNSSQIKLDVGRGCPFKCTYCTTSDFFSKKYRTKSAERIISEMKLASVNFRIKHFSFAHDMFTLDQSLVVKLCASLKSFYKEYGKTFTWTCSARIDCVSENLLGIMSEAGCRSIFFGIESGSGKIQKIIKKNLNITEGYKIADTCRILGIDMHASFMIGFAEETKADIEKTLQSVLRFAVRGALVQVSELTLLPGTPLYSEFRKSLKYDGYFSNFSHSVCSKPELDLIMNDPEMFSSFYYLPVKSMGRHTMLLLCRLINLLNEFRNTLFLLKDLILRDIEKFNLLDLFYLRLREIKKQEKSDFPLISVLIGILKDYLQFKADSGIPPYTFDILIWEATQGLLKGNFLRWHLINPQDKKKEESGSGAKKEWRICPAPVWQLIKTDYNIPFVIPSFNGWEVDKRKISKGVFYFILVAVSEIKCKFIRIGEKEYHTLDSLMKLPSEEFTERISSMMDEKGLHKLVNKLFSTGIIEAVEKPDRKLF